MDAVRQHLNLGQQIGFGKENDGKQANGRQSVVLTHIIQECDCVRVIVYVRVVMSRDRGMRRAGGNRSVDCGDNFEYGIPTPPTCGLFLFGLISGCPVPRSVGHPQEITPNVSRIVK